MFRDKIQTEIRQHLQQTGHNATDSMIIEMAKKEEQNMFKTKSSKMLYRAGIVNFIKQIRDSSKQSKIHPNIQSYLDQ